MYLITSVDICLILTTSYDGLIVIIYGFKLYFKNILFLYFEKPFLDIREKFSFFEILSRVML